LRTCSIRTVVRSSINRKQPSKILRPSRVNIMLKQSETLNILPIAGQRVYISGYSPRFDLFVPIHDVYFSCSKNAGIRATNVAETRHICEKKLERIDLKWRKSPLELSNLPFHGADFAKKAAD